jgi:hypothetical protein
MSRTIPTCDDLLERAEANPEAHLGRRSLNALGAYLMGHDVGLRTYGIVDARTSIDDDVYRAWVSSRLETRKDQELSGFSLKCYAQLISGTDYEAFDTYLKLWRQAERECPNTGPVPELVAPVIREAIPLRVILKPVLERPAMYFGSNSSSHELFAFCNGFLEVENDIGVEGLENRQLLQMFQEWLDCRYPFGKGRPWGHLFYFLSLQSGEGSLGAFTGHMDMFLNGEPPDAMNPVVQEVVENVLKHARAKGYRGTRKNPEPEPIKVPLNIVARIREGLVYKDDGVLRICGSLGWLCCISPEGDCYQERDPLVVEHSEDEMTIDRSRRAQLRVLVFGAERFPQLGRLIPTRPPWASDCPHCRGGWVDYPHQRIICFTCHGLGWVEEE